jgi:hypothetical protein
VRRVPAADEKPLHWLSAYASRSFAWRSAASGYPKSSNTFLDPRVIAADSPRRFVFLVISLGLSQSLLDQIHVSLAVLMPDGDFF